MPEPVEGIVFAGNVRARWGLVCVLLFATAAMGWLDYATGPEYGFSLFYLLPILAAAWWFGAPAALAVAAAATASWILAEESLHQAVSQTALLWNGFTRLVIFCGAGALAARVSRDRSRLTDLLERERRLGRLDPMTGLPNRRGFIERLMMEASRCRRVGQPICVAYLDLDNFKQINDRHGHAAGDEMLSRIGGALRSTVRAGDVAARLGGDEFAILFWNADRGAVERIARRVIERVSEVGGRYPDAGLGASVGIADFASAPESVEEILRRADGAMYQAKAAGKSRLVIWRSEAAPGVPSVR